MRAYHLVGVLGLLVVLAAAPYTARKVGEAVQFESTTQSEKEGEMAWIGRVRGDRLEGTMVWRKAGQAPIDYWFRGTLKGE